MEPFPFHYSHRNKSENPASVFLGSSRPQHSNDVGWDAAQEARLSDKIEGRCGGLEQCVTDVELRSEERFILLEMSHVEAEAEAERVEMDKQFGGLKLTLQELIKLLSARGWRKFAQNQLWAKFYRPLADGNFWIKVTSVGFI
jgi:hypothetical protein